MTHAERITAHLHLCDELYRLTVEENQIMKNERRPPDEAWREKKRELAARWDDSLARLRAPGDETLPPGGPDLERARQRCLQILHLDRENEQLLLRYSLGGSRQTTAVTANPAAALKAYGAPR